MTRRTSSRSRWSTTRYPRPPISLTRRMWREPAEAHDVQAKQVASASRRSDFRLERDDEVRRVIRLERCEFLEWIEATQGPELSAYSLMV